MNSLRIYNFKTGINFYRDPEIDKQISTYINHYEDYMFTCVFKCIKTQSVIIGGDSIVEIGHNPNNVAGNNPANDTGSVVAFVYCNTNFTWLKSNIFMYGHKQDNSFASTEERSYDYYKKLNYYPYNLPLLNYAAGNSNISYNIVSKNSNNRLYLNKHISMDIVSYNILSNITTEQAAVETVNSSFFRLGYAQIGSTFNHNHTQPAAHGVSNNIIMKPEDINTYYLSGNNMPAGTIVYRLYSPWRESNIKALCAIRF